MSNLDPPLIVAGLGRSGSSLAMQMLSAGGLPCTGSYPAFEEEQYTRRPPERPPPGATKILDMYNHPPADGPFRWIWLDRDYRDQAKSFAKFLLAVSGQRLAGRDLKVVAESYPKDRERCWKIMRRLGGNILTVRFEDLILSPTETAEKIAAFVGELNVRAMASAVVPRGTGCLPYMLEEKLIAIAEKETTTP